jgi:LacI family transcriptional regulator
MVLVNCGREDLPVPSVGVDERSAGDVAATHLLNLGHRRIGFVAGLEHYMPTREKTAGLRDALERWELPLDPGLITHAEWGFEGGAAGARRLLALGPRRPTALIASSDVMAIGALFAAHERGLRVPDDLSIVGFDGVAVGAYTTPPLTTVAQPTKEIAATVVEALQRLIDSPEREVPHSVFRPRLVVRASTAPPG